MVLRGFDYRKKLLQAKVLRHKVSPMHSDVSIALQLHTTVSFLLESSKERFENFLERNEIAEMGQPLRNC
jgi:hypothetical protein